MISLDLRIGLELENSRDYSTQVERLDSKLNNKVELPPRVLLNYDNTNTKLTRKNKIGCYREGMDTGRIVYGVGTNNRRIVY